MYNYGTGIIFLLFLFLVNIEIIVKSNKLYSLRKVHIYFLLVLFLILIYTEILSLLHNNISPEFHLKPVRLLVTSICLIIIIKVKQEVALHGVLIATIFHSFIVIIQYFGAYMDIEILANVFSKMSDNANPTKYRKSGMMPGFPSSGLFSLIGLILYNKASQLNAKVLNYLIISIFILSIILSSLLQYSCYCYTTLFCLLKTGN